MGRPQTNALNQYKEIASAYSIYVQCRKRELIVASIPKGSNGATSLKMLPFTDGLNLLPEAGGVLDQPYRLMCFFSAFEDGEQEAFSIKLK